MKYKATSQEWNAQLPYDIEENWLENIKKDLATIVQSNCSIGITEVTSNLKLYIELKLEISASDLAWFAKIFYSVITESTSSTSSSYCDLFVQLTQDEDDLPSDHLQLEWKPIYNLLYKFMYPQHGRSFTSNAASISSIVKVAKQATRFFPPNATSEILTEILPFLNLHDSNIFCSYLGLLTLFLPVRELPLDLSGKKANSFYWVPILMKLWTCCGNSSSLDMLFLDIFGRLFKYHGSYPERIGFTSEDLAFIFSRGARMMGLTVGSGTSGMDTKHMSKKGLSEFGVMDLGMPLGSYFHTSKTSSFARIIVYSLSADPSNNTMVHLESFFRAIEPFSHPSSSGKWSSSIAKLCSEISQTLQERCIQDASSSGRESIPLSRATIEQVTSLVSNIVQMMVFGKDSSSVSSSQSAIKYLAWVNPDAIIPSFLTAAYPSLQGLSETHRTISALGTLYSIATPLIRRSHFPSGGASLVSLLCLALPGLDVNDMAKSITTLIFIFAVVSNVPLVNSSTFPLTEMSSNHQDQESAFLPSPRSSADDDSCRQSTSEFEAWLAMFLDRIFLILENLPQNYGVGDNVTIEGNLLETIYFTCHILFSQLSSDLEDMVLRLLFKKAQSSLIPTATEAIGSLCGIIADSNPQKRLALFVPLCIESIKVEIENGAGSISSGNRFVANPNPFDFASMSDASLHWYQSILLKVVANSGPALLQYRESLLDIIALMASKCVSKRGYLWTGQLISSILDSLSGVYPTDFRSHSPKDWNDPEFRKRSYQSWGEFCKVSDLDVSWHIPSLEEREFAFDLALTYVKLSHSKLEELMLTQNSSNTASNDFSRWLSILNNCLMGSCTFLQPSTKSRNHENNGDFSALYSPSRLNLVLKAGFLFLPGEQKYDIWTGMIAETQSLFMRMLDFFTLQRTDDIESVKALLHCIKSHLSYGGLYDSASWIYSYSKTVLKAGKDETVLPRSILVSRVYMLHLRRVQEIIKSTPTTPAIYRLICRLLDFSLSKYAEIRKTAQSSLFSALRYHRSLRFDIAFKTLKVLKETGDARDPDRIKGALYVLKDRFSIMGVYIYYWEFTAMFIDAVLFNHTEEKPSVLEMIRQIVLEFGSLFLPGHFPEQVSQSESLTREISVEPSILLQFSSIKNSLDDRSKNAVDLVTRCILSSLSGKVNWRFEAMAIHFLDMIVPQSPITIEMINAVFSKIFEPNPTIRSNSHSVLAHMIDIIKDGITVAPSSSKLIVTKDSPIYTDVVKEISAFGERPSRKEECFVDKTVGWLILPESLKVYVSSKDGDYASFKSCEIGRLLIEKIEAESFWDKLLFFAGEESSKEQFKSSNADFYKRLFLIVEDSCFEMILTRIEQLVAKTQENHSQRLASELVAGIIRGSKHWSVEKKKVENSLFPLLFKGIQTSTMESIRHWLACVRYVLSRRDPARLAPIVNYIVDMPLDLESTSFLSESKKLWLKDLVLQTCSFRVRFHVSKILAQLTDYISTPFQQVRDAFGRCLDDCLQLLWSRRYDSLEELVNAGRFEPTKLAISHHINVISGQLIEWKKLPHKLGTPSIYANACKSVLAWFGYALTSYQVPGIANSFPLLLSLILDMQDFPDTDLANMAAQILKIYPNFLHSTIQLDLIVDILIALCLKPSDSPVREVFSDESKSWHLKARILPILQVFYFRHVYSLSVGARGKIMELLDNLLADQQVEVRRLASITLSGIVQCSEKRSIDALINRYKANLTTFKLPRRKRNDPIPEGYTKILHQRHSSVLGLSSLVLAFPYELPVWMPRVLVLLADCASDPSPISNSISHVFGEFKRTHQDSWETDKLKFSSDDLYIVTDLIYSSSYFA